MSFSDELREDVERLNLEAEQVFFRAVGEVFNSIVFGSPLTGAPGQPVREGTLQRSFTVKQVNPRLFFVESSDPKAIYVEIDARDLVFKNGGPHNVKLTQLNFQKLVDQAAVGSVFGGGGGR